MSVDRERKLKRRVTACRKRLRRWIQMRDAHCLRESLEGGDGAELRAIVFRDSIAAAQQQLEVAVAKYKALKCP